MLTKNRNADSINELRADETGEIFSLLPPGQRIILGRGGCRGGEQEELGFGC